MIVIMKRGTPQKEIDSLTDALTAKGVEVNPVIGKDLIILGLVGDTSKIDDTWIEANRSVERVMHVACLLYTSMRLLWAPAALRSLLTAIP